MGSDSVHQSKTHKIDKKSKPEEITLTLNRRKRWSIWFSEMHHPCVSTLNQNVTIARD